MNNVIENLYDFRRKSQDDNNPAEIVINPLENSMYGKNIIKPVETGTITIAEIILRNIFHLIIITLIAPSKLMGNTKYTKLNQLCLSLSIATVGLEFYPCLNEL